MKIFFCFSTLEYKPWLNQMPRGVSRSLTFFKQFSLWAKSLIPSCRSSSPFIERLPSLEVRRRRLGGWANRGFKMVGILSKIPPPAWLNSKASGIAVAAAAAGIVVLWKKKLDQLSSKRYACLWSIAQNHTWPMPQVQLLCTSLLFCFLLRHDF